MKPVVSLCRVNKIYKMGEGLQFQALNDINLTIKKGEFVAIIGPSGSGKSTLMHIIGLLDHPTSGSYTLEGKDCAHLKEETLASLRNQKIGFVFQSFNLLARTTALENVALPLVYSDIEYDVRIKRAKIALESVSLGDKLESKPNQLSGGQQQRVAIARALVTNPEVILADEPTGNLDSKSGREIMKLFQDLHRVGRTIVLITHDPEVAKSARRKIRMQDGRIVS